MRGRKRRLRSAMPGSHKLFQDILVVEEGHMDQFRLEMENSKEYGKEYLALQVVDNLKNAE